MFYSVDMEIRTIVPDEYRTAAGLIFSGQPEQEREQRTAALLQLLADGVCTPEGWFVSIEGNTISGTLLTQLLPTGTAIFTLPSGAEHAQAPLLAFALQHLRSNGFHQATLFVDATEVDSPTLPLFEVNGFRFITHLQSMQVLIEVCSKPDLGSMYLEAFREGDDELFGEIIQATYEDSLDAPEAFFERSVIDTVATYRQGDPTLPNWWIARDSDSTPVGVVLLSQVIGLGVELAYLGLVPKMRGLGLGSRLLDAMFWQAGQLDAKVLTVTVDERNIPAMKIYERKGFTLYQSQRLYLWKSTWST